jgi:hypothetical protein
MQDKNGKVIAYSAYNPNTGKNKYNFLHFLLLLDGWQSFDSSIAQSLNF